MNSVTCLSRRIGIEKGTESLVCRFWKWGERQKSLSRHNPVQTYHKGMDILKTTSSHFTSRTLALHVRFILIIFITYFLIYAQKFDTDLISQRFLLLKKLFMGRSVSLTLSKNYHSIVKWLHDQSKLYIDVF